MGIGLAIGAVGAGLNAGLNAAVAGKQAAIAGQNVAEQGALRTQAMGDVGQAINSAAGMPAAAGGYGMAAAGDYSKALAGAGTISAAPAIAGADPRYAAANATNAASVGNYTHALTGALSTATGVQQAQRLAEQDAMTEATNVSALQSQSYADTLVNQMRMQTIRANPLLSGLAKGMMATGAVMGLGSLASGAFDAAATPGINGAAGLASASGTDFAEQVGEGEGGLAANAANLAGAT